MSEEAHRLHAWNPEITWNTLCGHALYNQNPAEETQWHRTIPKLPVKKHPPKLHIKPCFCIAIPDRIHPTPATPHPIVITDLNSIHPFSLATQAPHVQDTARKEPSHPVPVPQIPTSHHHPRNTNTTFPPPALLRRITPPTPSRPVGAHTYVHIPVRPGR